MLVKNIIKLLAIDFTNIEIIGSYKDPKIEYFSDIDCQEDVVRLSKKGFIKRLQENIKEIKEVNGVYFVDLKFGTFRESALHFTEEEALSGDKVVVGKKEPITLEELLLTKSIIKLDVIAYIKPQKRFIEFSCNYYYHNEGIVTRPDKVLELKDAFKNEYLSKIDKGEFAKAIKRIYRLSMVTKNHVLANQCRTFLNSGVGHLNLILEILKTLKTVINLESFGAWKHFDEEVVSISSTLRKLHHRKLAFQINNLQDERDIEVIDDVLESGIMSLDGYVQPKAEEFLKRISRLKSFLDNFS